MDNEDFGATVGNLALFHFSFALGSRCVRSTLASSKRPTTYDPGERKVLSNSPARVPEAPVTIHSWAGVLHCRSNFPCLLTRGWHPDNFTILESRIDLMR